jgi:hypothetical protein
LLVILFVLCLSGQVVFDGALSGFNTVWAHDFGGPSGGGPPPPPPPPPPPGGGGGPGSGGGGGDPFDLYDGRELFFETDFVLAGLVPIKIGRYYDSQVSYDSPLGYGWSMTFNERLYRTPDGSIVMRRDSGVRRVFVESGGAYVTPAGERGELVENPDGTFTFTETRDILTSTGYIREYDINGRLVEVKDGFGNKLVLTYDPRGKLPLTGKSRFALDPAASTVVALDYRLTRIDEFAEDGSATGRWILFFYDEADGPTKGRLTRITDNNFRNWFYSHDPNGNLTQVKDPENNEINYTYADANDVNNLTLITGGYFAREISYDDQDRVIQQIIGEVEVNAEYLTPLVQTRLTELVRNAGGDVITQKETVYEFNSLGNPVKITFDDGREIRYQRNGIGQMTLTEYFTGPTLEKTETFAYDSQGLLQSITTTDLASGEMITRSFTYTGQALSSISLASNQLAGNTFEIQYTYSTDGGGNPLNITTQRVLKNPGAAVPEFDETTYTYNSRGQLLTVSEINDPATTAVTLGYLNDFMTSVTTAAGSVNYVRDGRGNITQSTVAGATINYGYDDTDRLENVILPSGEVLNYTWNGPYMVSVFSTEGYSLNYLYDGFNRLTTVSRTLAATTVNILTFVYDKAAGTITATDNRGGSWVYTYDPLGIYVVFESLIDSSELPSVIPLKQYDFPTYTEPANFVIGHMLGRYKPIIRIPLK